MDQVGGSRLLGFQVQESEHAAGNVKIKHLREMQRIWESAGNTKLFEF